MSRVPLREPSEFLESFQQLEESAWYIHHTPEGRYYFDRQENLTKSSKASRTTRRENQVDDLIRHRLRDMFKPTRNLPTRKSCRCPSWKTSLTRSAKITS